MNRQRVKICGLRHPSQAQAITALGFQTLGFICVPTSPRYVTPQQIRDIMALLSPTIATIGVFANQAAEEIEAVVKETGLTGIQLHGNETPAFCQQLRRQCPGQELIKALRIPQASALEQASAYYAVVDSLLLDAYHPEQLGGTGHTLPWADLGIFQPPIPWFLAGGLTPNNVALALSYLQPDGLDLSSGVEVAPGDKDLEKVQSLKLALAQAGWTLA
ncbi:phosphoribosylanthranilate isomerase [Synechocystis sp. LKSZ1]|uniref:phosphoribosylanthranilate isomerase n=1 Tax=Synechocystis sp. LKSZ1 TaxID=3144951 RepID=UPI00336BC4BE